ncbi:MAG: hypothetical protein ACFB0B_19950 [Thermonemataceae bacterium]
MSTIEFRKVRDLGQVLNVTFAFIKENLKHLVKNVVLITGPFILLAAAAWIIVPKDEFVELDQVDPYDLLILFGLIFSFLSIFSVVMITAVYQYLLLYQAKGASSFDTADLFQAILQKIVMVLGTFLGIGLVLGGAFFLVSLLLSTVGALLGVVGVILSIILVIASFVPLLYFSVIFSLVVIIRLVEGKGFIEAIRRSFFLIKNHWWETFIVIFVTTLIQSAIGYLISLPLMIYGFAEGVFSTTSSASYDQFNFLAILYGVSLIINIFTSIIPILAIAFQYYSLVERKESKSLVEQIETVGNYSVTEEDPEEDY